MFSSKPFCARLSRVSFTGFPAAYRFSSGERLLRSSRLFAVPSLRFSSDSLAGSRSGKRKRLKAKPSAKVDAATARRIADLKESAEDETLLRRIKRGTVSFMTTGMGTPEVRQRAQEKKDRSMDWTLIAVMGMVIMIMGAFMCYQDWVPFIKPPAATYRSHASKQTDTNSDEAADNSQREKEEKSSELSAAQMDKYKEEKKRFYTNAKKKQIMGIFEAMLVATHKPQTMFLSGECLAADRRIAKFAESNERNLLAVHRTDGGQSPEQWSEATAVSTGDIVLHSLLGVGDEHAIRHFQPQHSKSRAEIEQMYLDKLAEHSVAEMDRRVAQKRNQSQQGTAANALRREEWRQLPREHPQRQVAEKRRDYAELAQILEGLSHVGLVMLPPLDSLNLPAAIKRVETYVWLDSFLEDFRVLFFFREKKTSAEHLNLVILNIGYKSYWMRPAIRADGLSDLSQWSLDVEPIERMAAYSALRDWRSDFRKKWWYRVDPVKHSIYRVQDIDYRHFFKQGGSKKRFEIQRKKLHRKLGEDEPDFDLLDSTVEPLQPLEHQSAVSATIT